MAELWKTRRWRFLLDLIDQLPRHSRYSEAQADDEELADAIIRSSRELPAYKVRLAEFDAVREELMVVSDRLGTLISMKSGKPLPPRPRPVTAIERARERQRRNQHEELVAQVLPHKRPE